MGKRSWWIVVLASLCAAAPAQAKVSLKLRSVDERAVKVRIVAPAGAARLSATPRGVVRAKRVRLRRAGRRTVTLRLTRYGRRAVGDCSVRRITVRLRAGGARRRRALAVGSCVGVPAGPAAPPGGKAPSPAPGEPDPGPEEPEPAPAGPSEGTLGDAALATVPGCDFLDPFACLLPFPNDLWTRPDPTTPTGLRLNLPLSAMPRNAAGKPIDPTDLNRSDGWSTGTPILTKVPGLTLNGFRLSGIVPQTDMARAFDAEQPVVLIDAETGRRQPIWAEMDRHPQTKDGNRVLMIRPARNLETGRRYVVAIRNLVDAYRRPLSASRRFELYRDDIRTLNPAIEGRRAHMETVFADLERAGIERESLIIAWDFTTASTADRTGPMLHIRDDAFAQLGDSDLSDLEVSGSAPAYEITAVETFQPCSAGATPACEAGESEHVARRVSGTLTVPCYLDKPGCPPVAGRFHRDAATGLPAQLPGNTVDAPFVCNVPHAALAQPARASLYGHGLFGSETEVDAGNVKAMAGEHDIAFCATDWIGMATEDVPNVATILLDLSNFSTLTDRVQQGILNFLYLGRLMIHPQGLADDEAFRAGGRALLDTRHLYYDGNSQGGIIGTALMAVTPDAQRGVLGVPGINYSTLLQRSSDFESPPGEPCPAPPGQVLEDLQEPELDPEYALELFNLSYACPLYAAYPNQAERQLLFALIQQLWDRAEGNGYAAFIRGGLPDTPAHEVLLHGALGDHQVAQIAAETAARTIGAGIRSDPFDPGRSLDVRPAFGIERIGFPHAGSALEIWDSGPVRPDPADCQNHGGGTEVAPAANVPPRCGRDPHGEPRSTRSARAQKSAFLRPPGESAVIDVCAGGPCHSRGWMGSE